MLVAKEKVIVQPVIVAELTLFGAEGMIMIQNSDALKVRNFVPVKLAHT